MSRMNSMLQLISSIRFFQDDLFQTRHCRNIRANCVAGKACCPAHESDRKAANAPDNKATVFHVGTCEAHEEPHEQRPELTAAQCTAIPTWRGPSSSQIHDSTKLYRTSSPHTSLGNQSRCKTTPPMASQR